MREIEEFDYGRTLITSSAKTIEPDPSIPSDPNQVPPSDPTTQEDKKLSGIRHTLKRWEPAGAISPEDHEWDELTPMWIAAAETPTQSYELVKEWVEGRTDEWIYTERESISFNRYQPEAAAESRARIKETPGGVYFKNMFCALMLAKSTRKVSSSGNTQPPAPDTLPSTHGVKNDTKLYKYKMPIDTDFPFRQKKTEISIEHLSIDGNKLAEIGGKLAWGRFKGITVESEFSQHWWDYQPLCRVNILEPNITPTGDLIDTSAYLGEAFSIAIANGQCAIGIDGIFLGFVQNDVLIPPFVETVNIEIEARSIDVWKTTQDNEAPPDPVTVNIEIEARSIDVWKTTINPPTNVRLIPQTNTNKNEPFSSDSGTAILNPKTGYKEAYIISATWEKPEADIYNGLNSGPEIARYEVSLKKNGGAWSSPINVTTTAFDMNTIATAIPGISYVSNTNPNTTYVGPGIYELKIVAVGTSGSRSEAYSASMSYPSEITIATILGLPNDVYIGTEYPLQAQFGFNTIDVLAGFPGYSPIVPIWTIKSGPASISSDGILIANSHYITNSSDPNHAPIVISLSAAGYDSIADTETVYALDPSGPTITGINLICSNQFISNNALDFQGEPTMLGFYATVYGSGNFNDDVEWSVVSGDATFSKTTTIDADDATYLYCNSSNIVIRGTSQLSTIYQEVSITFTSQGAVTAVNIVESGPIEVTMGDYTDLTYTVSTNGGSMGNLPWQSVNCSVISGDESYVSILTGSGYVSIDVTNGTPIGESIIIKVASAVDAAIFDTIEVIAKAIVSGVVIVPSKTAIDANETFTAQAYLTGQGVGTGVGSVGTQQFNWSVSGPANLANSIAQTATITGTDIADTIVLSASFGAVSSSTNITNTGQTPGGDWTMVESYTVTRSPGGYGTVNYAKLNDFNFYTGVTAYNSSNSDTFININLGSALTVKAVDMAGGYLDPPWPNGSIADYLNGGFLEYSTNNSTWTTYVTIADVTDYDGDYKRYTPNITAQFWRIRRQTWAAISELNFWV
jgi:hypothetical protein